MTTYSEPIAIGQAQNRRLGMVLALFSLLLAPLGLLADKAVVPLVLAAALAGGIAAGRAALPWRSLDRDLALAFGLFIAWCLLTTVWSLDPLAAATLALRVGLMLFALLYLATLAQLLDAPQRRRVAHGFCLGFGVTVLVIAVDLAFGAPIFTLLKGPAESTYAAISQLNRGVSVVAILVWPLAALAWQQRQRWLAVALPPALFAFTLLSESSASMLALGAGLLAAALASLGRGAARLVMAVAVVTALLGSPAIAELLQHAGLEQNRLVSQTGLYRLHVWNFVTDRIAERPVLGWGFDASPSLPTEGVEPFRPGKKVVPSHPHNGPLQIMVEIGAVGSLLVVALLFLIGRRIDSLGPQRRSFAVAMLVTILSIASTAYGIWQSHWLAMIGGCTVVFVATLQARGDEEARSLP